MSRRAALLLVLMLLGVLLTATPALAEEGESLTPSPAQLEFGAVDLHFGGSPRKTVQFASFSPLPLIVSSTSISGADDSQFQIVGDGCSGKLVELFESCSVEVEFHPASGPQSATLELLTGLTAATVPLSGGGITGSLSASPEPLSFSPIPFTPPGHEGENQETEQVNVLNSHAAGTQIESVSITGPDASSFSIQYGNCEQNLLAPNNSCDVGVRFAAGSPGPKTASLVLNSDSASTPLVVPLEGEALNGPQISVASTQALLGDVPIGSSAQHAFTITNTGDYPLFVQQDFLISGTPLMFPMLSDTCSAQIVDPGNSCELTVGFEPTTLGEKDASIVLITNASPIHVLGIDGVGVHSAASNTPSLTAPAAPAPVEAPAPAKLASTPAPGGTLAGAVSEILAVERAPRLQRSITRAALDTGLLAQCPAQLGGCEALGLVTASIRAGATRAGGRRPASTPVLLGSTLTQLHSGQSSRVRIPFSHRAIVLLRQRRHVRARVETIIRAGGRVLAQRTLLVTLAPLSDADASRSGSG